MGSHKKAAIPYEHAEAGDRALVELQKYLLAFGCQNFGVMTDNERECMVVVFKWRERHVKLEASWKGYAQALIKAHKWKDTDQRVVNAAIAQGKISVCSCLRDWVKGQVTAIECGVMSFEAAFMPHMLLPSGQRVVDAAGPHFERLIRGPGPQADSGGASS